MGNKLDKQYTDLLLDILENGVEKEDRTGTGTVSVFGRQIRHKMSEGFPLLTTKKMPFKTIVTELLWFLQGRTDLRYLLENNCHIWTGDAYKVYDKDFDREHPPFSAPYPTRLTEKEFEEKIMSDDNFNNQYGDLGPIYGKQWRSWTSASLEEQWGYGKIDGHPIGGKQYSKFNSNVHIDQIQNLINDLKSNPDSRRLMVNAWNVGELDQMTLPPCHYGFQVYTRELNREERVDLYIKKYGDTGMDYEKYKNTTPTRAISLMWNQRSVDTFLGLPFNIASYGLLLMMLADEVNMVPDELIGNLGDVHLYSNHIEQAKEQIGRELTFDEFWDSLTSKQKGTMEKPYEGETYNGIDSRIELMNIMSEINNIPKRIREPYPLPRVHVRDGIYCSSIQDVLLFDYQSHPPIKAPLSN